MWAKKKPEIRISGTIRATKRIRTRKQKRREDEEKKGKITLVKINY